MLVVACGASVRTRTAAAGVMALCDAWRVGANVRILTTAPGDEALALVLIGAGGVMICDAPCPPAPDCGSG